MKRSSSPSTSKPARRRSSEFALGEQVSNIRSVTQYGSVTNVTTVPGSVSALRVTDDSIYADNDGTLLAFSLAGEPLPTPSQELAFPSIVRRITAGNAGLSLDGTLIAPTANAFAETTDGVYYIPAAAPFGVNYIPFSNTSNDRLIALGGTGSIQNLWASGTNLYASEWLGANTYGLTYADASFLGKSR